jgi:hypothetical protein
MKDLKGTEKQVVWATEIREAAVKLWDKWEAMGCGSYEAETIKNIFENEDRATWYINNREPLKSISGIERICSIIMNIVEPDEKKFDEWVMVDGFVRFETQTVYLYYQKCDEFIKIVKENGYRWDGDAWYKKVDNYIKEEFEISKKLYDNGFAISISDRKIRRRLVEQ